MEMFIATLAHRYVFSYKEYQPRKHAGGGVAFASALAQMIDPTTTLDEIHGLAQHGLAQLTHNSNQTASNGQVVSSVSGTERASTQGSM